MLEKCTNTSFPSGLMMNPKPFLESNHLTFPVGMAGLPQIALRDAPSSPQSSPEWRRPARLRCPAGARPGYFRFDVIRDARGKSQLYQKGWIGTNIFSIFCERGSAAHARAHTPRGRPCGTRAARRIDTGIPDLY